MFSTTTGWPKSLDMPCASARPKMSAGPPAGKPMIMRTGLFGYVCALASTGNSASASSLSNLIAPPFSVAARSHAAVDHDLGARDEARLIRGQEQHGVRGIAPVAGKAQGDALHAALEQRLDVAARALLGEAGLDHRRMELSRHHAVDANAFGRVLHGDHARALDDARLGRGIRDLRRAAPANARGRSDVDDAAATLA